MAGEPHILAVPSGRPPRGSDGFGGEGVENRVTPLGQTLVSKRSIDVREVRRVRAEDWADERAVSWAAAVRAAANVPAFALPPLVDVVVMEGEGEGRRKEGSARRRCIVAGVIYGSASSSERWVGDSYHSSGSNWVPASEASAYAFASHLPPTNATLKPVGVVKVPLFPFA